MLPRKKHRVLITNPHAIGGKPNVVVQGVKTQGYIIVPIEAGLFEVYMGNTYLGEAESDAQIRKLIERDGASAPVLIQNPSGGYEMYSYSRPTGNPKKKRKKGAKKKKAAKRKNPHKTKKSSKGKKRKKNAGKRKAPRKKTGKKVSPRKKKRIAKAKKKVKSAKKKLSKAKSALGKAKRSPNPSKPTTNPRKRKHKKAPKKSMTPAAKSTIGDINAYVKRVTGKRF